MKSPIKYIFAVGIVALLQACAPNNNYKIKEFAMPKNIRGTDSLNHKTDSNDIIKISWKDFFKDEQLNNLIEKGLQNNFDLKKSLKNIEIANQRYAEAKLQWLPNINSNPGNLIYRYRSDNFNSNPSSNYYSQTNNTAPETMFTYFAENISSVTLSWEIDIWGKIKSQKAQSLANYLKTTEAQKLIQTNVVSKIAEGYFNLILLNTQLQVAQSNFNLNKNTLKFVELQYEAGKTTALAKQQTRSQMLIAKAMIPKLERQIMVQENNLKFLIGDLPDSLNIANSNFDFLLQNDTFSSNVPLEMVSLRPDVKSANYELQAKNAQVGVAQRNRYPKLDINLSGGLNSLLVKNWFDIPGSLMGNVIGNLSQPIFNNRKLKTAFEVAKLQREQAEIEFQKTVYTAINEISDALINLNKIDEELEIAKEQLETAQLGSKQATLLFNSGYATYLEVINSQRVALNTELSYNQLKLSKLNARIKLYKALGGGWN